MKKKIEYCSSMLGLIGKRVGYDACSAICELVDNSIGARSNYIQIEYDEVSGYFTIRDNGIGMSEEEFIGNYMRAGYSSSIDNPKVMGCFGLGGKMSIVYLIGEKYCTVKSKTGKPGTVKHIESFWSVDKETTDEYEYNVVDGEFVGTEISFTIGQDLNIEELKNLLGVIYCEEIVGGVSIKIKDMHSGVNESVNAQDPLYRNNKIVKEKNLFSGYRDFYIKTKDHNGESKTSIVTVSYTAFHEDLPKECILPYDTKGNKKSVRTQGRSGLYIKTSGGRYITLGCGLDKALDEAPYAKCNGLRIEINIQKEVWGAIGMMFNKGDKITPFYKIPEFNDPMNDDKNNVCKFMKRVYDDYVRIEGYNRETKKGIAPEYDFEKSLDKLDFGDFTICFSNREGLENNEPIWMEDNIIFLNNDTFKDTKSWPTSRFQGFMECLSASLRVLSKYENETICEEFLMAVCDNL